MSLIGEALMRTIQLMIRRVVPPTLFLLGALLGLLAALDVVGFWGGTGAIGCIVLGVAALPMGKPNRS